MNAELTIKFELENGNFSTWEVEGSNGVIAGGAFDADGNTTIEEKYEVERPELYLMMVEASMNGEIPAKPSCFTDTPEKHEEIRRFAKSIIEKNTQDFIDEWHQFDDFHDVHISDSEETANKIDIWVYPVVKDRQGFDTTDTSEGFEVIL